MSTESIYTTIEAEIEHGQIMAKEPEKLPERGRGLLIIFPPANGSEAVESSRHRIQLPLIRGNGQRIDPTAEQLDASLWD